MTTRTPTPSDAAPGDATRDETGQPAEPTIGKLIADASADMSSLVRQEIELAKTELRFSVKAGGIGAALLVAALYILVLASVLLSIAFAYLLAMTGMDPAWAFLIVFGAYVLVAGLLAFVGIRRFKKVKAPEQTIDAVKKNKLAFKR
jgi:Putative Actinobacterial Holin-X, holin superfamily III